MDLPAYRYSPLPTNVPTIRLLEILPLGQSGEFACRLKYVSLQDEPDYTSLSYCWGTPEGTISVACVDDQGQRTKLLITATLDSFLRQVMAEINNSSTRLALWVDALCINQADLEEKNSQIAMMHEIYQRAKHVIVWLGDGIEEGSKAMDIIPRLAAVEEQANLLKEDPNFTVGGREPMSVRLGLPRDGAEEYMALSALFRNPWFARVWIIQEVAMATHVVVKCGSRSVSWDDFVRAFYVLHSLNMIMPDPARYAQSVIRTLGIIDARASRLAGHDRDTLGTLLRCRSSLATNPRDKVFGVLGLTTDAHALDFRPDYKSEVHEAYTDIAFAIIKHEGSLDVLGVPRGTGPSAAPFLPSWAPDWSTWASTSALNRRDRPANCPGDDEVLIRNASGATKPTARLREGRLLELEGYACDQISEVGHLLHSEDELMDYNVWLIDGIKFYKQNTQTLLNWESMAQARNKGLTYQPTGESITDAYWHIITAGWQVADEDKLSTAQFFKWDSYHRPGARLRRRVGSLATTSAYAWLTFVLNCGRQLVRPPPNSGFDRSVSMASNRRLVRSKSGYLGLAPAETRVGDAIALVKGAGSPLVIRAAGERRWELVGDSYVHGMMNGECFDLERCGVMWFA